MKNIINSFCYLAFLFLLSCKSDNKQVEQYFFVKIDGKDWSAKPIKDQLTYNVNYKPLSHQLSIIAQAKDGSKIEISFHSANKISPGLYPSTLNDNGILSGVFYFPVVENLGYEMASVTYNQPIQENVIEIIKVEKMDSNSYIIEGRFSLNLYALSKNNPNKISRLTDGKFKVCYNPELIGQTF